MFLSLVFFGLSQATAADLYRGAGAFCDYRLEGEIRTGDAWKIAQIQPGSMVATLCLDSEGGNLAEGLALFERIWAANIDTVILPGDVCLSACALAFMGGSNVQGTDLTRQIERSIFPGATVAFHGPKLDLPDDRLVPTSQVEASFRIAMNAAYGMFQLTQIRERSGTTFSDFLFGIFLGTPPDEYYPIDSIGDLVLADVTPAGYWVDFELNPKSAYNACVNFFVKNPPKDSYFSWSANAEDHYLQTLDFTYEPETKGAFSWRTALDAIVVRTDPDGRQLDRPYGIVGPFFSGTKFWNVFCRVQRREGAGTGFSVSLGNAQRDELDPITSPKDREFLSSLSDTVFASAFVPAFFGYSPHHKLDEIPLADQAWRLLRTEDAARATAVAVDAGCSENFLLSPKGRAWVQIAETEGFEEARSTFYRFRSDWPHTDFFLTKAATHAVVIGSIDLETEQHLLAQWIADGRVPPEARLTGGETYACAFRPELFQPER